MATGVRQSGGHRRAEALGYAYKARHPEGTRRAGSGQAGSDRRAEALGYAYKARLRGLVQATQAGFVHLACPFMGQAVRPSDNTTAVARATRLILRG